MTSATDRPTGVAAMAAVAGITGVVDILTGLGDIGIAGGFLSDHGFGDTLDGIMNVVGLVLVAVGVLGLATAFGLWRGRNWAWLITRLWASVCIVVGLVGAGTVAARRHADQPDPRAIVGSTATAIVAAVVLWYLYRPHVQGDVRAHLIGGEWPARRDSNPRPTDPKSVALIH